jgi:hypothetical protein
MHVKKDKKRCVFFTKVRARSLFLDPYSLLSHSLLTSYTHSFTYLLTHSRTHSLTHMSQCSRPIDVLVFGATGFTGKEVVRHLHTAAGTHSLTYSLTHSLTHSLTLHIISISHMLTLTRMELTHSLTSSLSFKDSAGFNHPLTHSINQLINQSLINLLSHSLTHSLRPRNQMGSCREK